MTTFISGGDELRKPIASADDVVAHVAGFSKDPSAFKIGMEYERLGVNRVTGKVIPFTKGVETILDELARIDGWKRGREEGRIIFLEREGDTITLEPGGQTEFSSKPVTTIAELLERARSFEIKLDQAAKCVDAVYLGIGYQPFSKLADVEWVPKKRYEYMAPYLAARGSLAHEMMTLTAGAQIALDYSSPEDAMRKLRAAALLTPVAQALFASSGVVDGRGGKDICRRGLIWMETDPVRCGIPGFFLDKNAGLGDYIDWIMRIPLMFVERNGEFSPSNGRTLSDLLAEGKATIYDAELALTQAFPEVRIKHFVEVRCLDSPQPRFQAVAACFWSSFLYGDLDQIFTLFGELSRGDFEELRIAALRDGLKGRAAGRTVQDWALDALKIAGESSTCDSSLAHLRRRAESGRSPADGARDLLQSSRTNEEFVSNWNEYRWL